MKPIVWIGIVLMSVYIFCAGGQFQIASELHDSTLIAIAVVKLVICIAYLLMKTATAIKFAQRPKDPA